MVINNYKIISFCRFILGYNTEWGKTILKQLLSKCESNDPKIALLTILFGANDAAFPIKVQHVELNQYKQNLKEMVQVTKQFDPSIRIVFITPPPLDEEAWEKTNFIRHNITRKERNAETTQKYASACVEVAQELSLPVVNLWKLITDSVNDDNSKLTLKDYLCDGLHLASRGNEVKNK